MDLNFKQLRYECTHKMLQLYKKANAGHIGSSLSCMEILIQVIFGEMRSLDDQLILSKGHAACGLYVTLAAAGRMSNIDLESFYKDGTYLAAHPPCGGVISSIPFGTGSLGHGLSLATGLVFSQRFTNRNFKTFAILSEGDCNEGSTWEAALFAGHHRLENLCVIIDLNGLQGIGRSQDILDLRDVGAKWREFGFESVVCENGNDFSSLNSAFTSLSDVKGRPKCIVAKTKKGHGVSFMQDTVKWHYLPMTDAQFEQALVETEELNA